MKPIITDYKTWVKRTSETLNESGPPAQKTEPNKLALELANMRMEIDLLPWQVPNYVTQSLKLGFKQDGFKEAPTFLLSEVPAETLAAMCDEFRQEVFRKAGKKDPNNKNRF